MKEDVLNNDEVKSMAQMIWHWWNQYKFLNNDSEDRDKHFSDEKWIQIIRSFDEICDKYKSEFVERLMGAYLYELQMRSENVTIKNYDV